MSAHQKPFLRKAGRYLILESLGAGSTGEVYKAFDPLINRAVAIKVLRLDVLETGPARSFIDRFYHEARIVGTLSHPHIITLFDAGQTESQLPFLAFEYADGPTILQRIGTGESFSTQETLHFLSQTAAALDYAHGLGVIHRDIKPSNLIIHRRKDIKITDFGIAKLVQADPAREPSGPVATGTYFTHGGSLLGTPSYMSPEQAQGLPLDGRTDVFSLAVVAFEMLSGELPFAGGSITATLYRLVHLEPEHPADLDRRGFHSVKWRELFSRALAKDPRERFATATALVDAIHSLSTSRAAIALSAAPRTPAGASPAEAAPPTTTLPVPGAGEPARAETRLDRGIPHFAHRGHRRLPAGAPIWLSLGALLSAAFLWLWLTSARQLPLAAVELLVPEPPAFEPPLPDEPKVAPRRRPRARESRKLAAIKTAPPATRASAESSASQPVFRSAPLNPLPVAGEVDVLPRRVDGREVRYPETARKDAFVGRVEVGFLVTENGLVRDVVVEVSTGTALDQAVVEAVKSWRFEPARRNGLPVAVRQRYRHEFRKPS